MKDWIFVVVLALFLGFIGLKSCSTEQVSSGLGCVSAETMYFPSPLLYGDQETARACARRAYSEGLHSQWLFWSFGGAQSAGKGETGIQWWVRTQVYRQ